MNWTELLKAALVLVVSFGLRMLLQAVGVEIDDALFNTLVTAIVVWILAQFGIDAARALRVRGIK